MDWEGRAGRCPDDRLMAALAIISGRQRMEGQDDMEHVALGLRPTDEELDHMRWHDSRNRPVYDRCRILEVAEKIVYQKLRAGDE